MDTHARLLAASAVHLRGDLSTAEASYRTILAQEPENADVLFLLATLHIQRREFGQAVPLLKALLQVNPRHQDAWLSLAHALIENGESVAAANCYVTMLDHWPDDVQAYLGVGEIALAQGHSDTAIRAFEQALKFDPNLPTALFNLGLIHYQGKRLDSAESYYRRFLAAQPDSLKGHFNLGAVLHDLHRLDEAQAQYRLVLEADPSVAEAHRGLGNIALHERRYADAIEHFRAGLVHAPNDVELLSNLGVVLQKRNQIDAAEHVLRQAIALNPAHINAHFNLALVLLLKGNFTEGWQEYTWRLKIKHRLPVTFAQAEWAGEALDGQSILLRAEQGFGDTFQFVRYAPLVKALGGRVVLECQPELKRLLLRSPGIDLIAERTVSGQPLVAFERHLPMLSLPRVFNTQLATVPASFPYIRPEPWLVARWAARLAQDKKQRVGIVWAGRPTHEDDQNRSCQLVHFARLAGAANITLYSLQKGATAQDIDTLRSVGIIDLEPEIDDFADTAAVIENLDLLVCVDTSVAHLAGAMGKPVWIVLPFAPDFRWLARGELNPWYPTARLFRQAETNAWDGVFDDLCHALASFSPAKRLADTATAAEQIYDDETIAALRLARRAMRETDWRGMAACCESVLQRMPNHVEANALFGIALFKSDRASEALQYLVAAYEQWPQHPVLLKYLGMALQSCGEAAAAQAILLNALQFGNDDPEVLFNLGVLRQLAGDATQASGFYQAALAMKPEFAECLNNQGIALNALDQRSSAIEHFEKATQLAPNFFDPVLNLGNALYQAGRTGEAKACFERAIALHSQHAGAHNALGVVLKAQGATHAAIAAFEFALALDPSLHEARGNLGNALKQLGQLDQAVEQYRVSLDQHADNASVWSNLGNALQQQGEIAGALAAYDRAISIAPDYTEAHWNRALAWLMIEDYARGWPEYEWGFAAGARPLNPRNYPSWQGECLPGKTLLVSAEQGLGDSVQFARFLAGAKARVGKLVFECQPALVTLLGQCAGVDQIVENTLPDSSLPEIAARISLMSLPGVLGVTQDQLARTSFTLAASHVSRQRLAPYLTTGRMKVGIVWAGSSAHQDDGRRSCDLGLFKPLADVLGVQLYSLQKGERAQDLHRVDFPIVDLAPQLNDFAETAAALAALDLVVTVDTAVAHVSGTLQRPTWVLLPFAPDWRWGLVRRDSAWYATLRLFRQAHPGQWSPVLAEVSKMLAKRPA